MILDCGAIDGQAGRASADGTKLWLKRAEPG
jgi:hypothetical protein